MLVPPSPLPATITTMPAPAPTMAIQVGTGTRSRSSSQPNSAPNSGPAARMMETWATLVRLSATMNSVWSTPSSTAASSPGRPSARRLAAARPGPPRSIQANSSTVANSERQKMVVQSSLSSRRVTTPPVLQTSDARTISSRPRR